MVEEPLRPYFLRRDALSVQANCLRSGNRLVIPEIFRLHILKDMHLGHPGVVRMKSIARSYVWWPGIDDQIEVALKKCQHCLAHKSQPPKLISPWSPPEVPWSRVHIDFAGPVKGHIYFLAIDAFSKWPEVNKVHTTSSQAAIGALTSMIARFGIMDLIVSDNATAFTSFEFQQFCKRFAIRHITPAPYHPNTNGEVERLVQSCKNACDGTTDWLERWLFSYRTTQHATTKVPPAEIMLNYHPRTLLSIIAHQPTIAASRASPNPKRKFVIDDKVLVAATPNKQAMPGVIAGTLGSVMYQVRVGEKMLVRHVDQLKKIEDE